MNNGQINRLEITGKGLNHHTGFQSFTLEVNNSIKSVAYAAGSPFQHSPTDPPLKPTQEINEIVEQVLDMSIEEQNLLLSMLHKEIIKQREAKIKELAQEQKNYENALNFFEKFK